MARRRAGGDQRADRRGRRRGHAGVSAEPEPRRRSPPNAAAVAGVEQTNAGAARAAAEIDAAIGQEIDQNQLIGDSSAQEADAAQVHANAQDGLAAATIGQTRTTNLNDVTVPAGSRATNPSVRQQNLVSASATATDTSEIDAWIVQGQGGSADIELATATQQGSVRQSAATYSPASQSDLLNRAAWAGIEPAADTPPDTPGPIDVTDVPDVPAAQQHVPAPIAPPALVKGTRIAAGPPHVRHEATATGAKKTHRRSRSHTSVVVTVAGAGPVSTGSSTAPPTAPFAPPAVPRSETTTQIVASSIATEPASAAILAAVARSDATGHGGGNVPNDRARAGAGRGPDRPRLLSG